MQPATNGQSGRVIWICATCAVETDDLPAPPVACAVCEDERQWVPEDGQRWTTLAELREAGTRITVSEVETGLWGLRATPAVGIGQQTMVVRTPEGVLLFDCVGYVDEAALDFVRSLGRRWPWPPAIRTCTASRRSGPGPSAACRSSSRPRTPNGCAGVTPSSSSTTSGASSQPASPSTGWAGTSVDRPSSSGLRGAEGRGVLLAGDAVFPNPDRRSVSFMRSYPNRIPLSGNVVQRIAGQLEGLHFDRLYNNFGAVVPSDAKVVLRRSADRHAAWARGDFDHLT